jgi:hypothetical protein
MRLRLAPVPLIAVAALAVTGSSHAAGTPARATLAVKLTGTTAGASSPATKVAGTIRLPAGATSRGVTSLKGALTVKRGRRSVKLTALRLRAATQAIALSGRIGVATVTLAAATPARGAFSGGATGPALRATTLKLTRAGAGALNRRLKTRLQAGAILGTLSLTAAKPGPAPAGPTPTGPAPTQTAPPSTNPPVTTPPALPVDPFGADCPIGVTSQAPASGATVSDPAPVGTAATGGTFAWGFKQTFRNYIVNIAGGSLLGRLGATYAPDAFTFAFSGGSTSEPQTAPVKAVLHHTGTAIFCGLQHGFRIAIGNPTVVIDGAASQLIADVSANNTGALSDPERVSLATLDLTGITPAYDGIGKTLTWTGIPASLTAQASTVFGGFYGANTPLDPLTVVATVP